jgi:hypothetical protein
MGWSIALRDRKTLKYKKSRSSSSSSNRDHTVATAVSIYTLLYTYTIQYYNISRLESFNMAQHNKSNHPFHLLRQRVKTNLNKQFNNNNDKTNNNNNNNNKLVELIEKELYRYSDQDEKLYKQYFKVLSDLLKPINTDNNYNISNNNNIKDELINKSLSIKELFERIDEIQNKKLIEIKQLNENINQQSVSNLKELKDAHLVEAVKLSKAALDNINNINNSKLWFMQLYTYTLIRHILLGRSLINFVQSIIVCL